MTFSPRQPLMSREMIPQGKPKVPGCSSAAGRSRRGHGSAGAAPGAAAARRHHLTAGTGRERNARGVVGRWSTGTYRSLNKNDSEPIFRIETQSYGAGHGAENHEPVAHQESALFPCPGGRTRLANGRNINPVLVGGGSRNRKIQR